MTTTQIADINSAEIQHFATEAGIAEATLLGKGEARPGDANSLCAFYLLGDELGGVRVATTNGDPIWEESAPEDFANLAAACGLSL